MRAPVRALVAIGAVLAVLATSGCGFGGLYDKSLPGSVGGPFSSAKTYTVTARFADVLDLVPQSAVKVDDVTIGSVDGITLTPEMDPTTRQRTYVANVVMKVKQSVHLPYNTHATLEETSLLGEKFIQLSAPTAGATGVLKDGEVIDTNATVAYPNVEQVFGVLSTVLNGGGLQKLQSINTELTAALAGREDKVRDVLVQLNDFVGGLDGQKAQITRAIQSMDRLSIELNAQTGSIVTALDDLAPGIKILSSERANLVALLQGLSQLGIVSTRVINASVDNTKADLRALEPILTQLNAAGTALPGSLELLFDYPFPHNATDGIVGDDTSLYASVDLGGSLAAEGITLPSAVCTTLGQLPGSTTVTLLKGLCQSGGGNPTPPPVPGGPPPLTPPSTPPLTLPLKPPSVRLPTVPVPSATLPPIPGLIGGLLGSGSVGSTSPNSAGSPSSGGSSSGGGGLLGSLMGGLQ